MELLLGKHLLSSPEKPLFAHDFTDSGQLESGLLFRQHFYLGQVHRVVRVALGWLEAAAVCVVLETVGDYRARYGADSLEREVVNDTRGVKLVT